MTSFVAYIDESGDEGFRFLPKEAGSSRWFVLSAVVLRKRNDKETVELLKKVRESIKKPAKTALHFRNLKHEHRVPYVRLIGSSRLRAISVLIYKPELANAESFQNNAHRLYQYAARLLLERISWLCRDHAKSGEGDGSVDLVFSNRSATSYEDLRKYLTLLKDKFNPEECRIDWNTLKPERVRAVNHEQLAGLQIADAVASGIFFALNLNLYGEVEPRYFELLQPRFYRRKGVLLGYGLKLLPDYGKLKKTLNHLGMIERFI